MNGFSLHQGLTALAVVAVAAVVGCGDLSHSSGDKTPSRLRPQASEPGLVDLDDNPVDLWPGGAKSAATVIIFTRTDCPISNRYAPTVNQLHNEFGPRGVRFFLVYVDPQEGPEEIRRHLAEFGYPCPALRDPGHALVAATGATVTPEAIVFTATQTIAYRGRIDDWYVDFGKSRDAATTHELADAIEATLSGHSLSQPVTKAVGCPIADLK
jgi:hypothetical protein